MSDYKGPANGVEYITALAKRVQDLAVSVAALDTLHYVGTAGEPAFVTDWVNFGGGTDGLSFSKRGGLVVVNGTIGMTANKASGTTIFTLPAGYWPAGQLLFAVGAAGAFGRVDVSASGTVVNQQSLVVGNGIFMALTFPAAN